MNEIARYIVRDGKIAHDKFYYAVCARTIRATGRGRLMDRGSDGGVSELP